MKTLNTVTSKTNPIHKQFLNHRPIYAKPNFSISFRTPPPPIFSPSFFTIKASSSQNPKPLLAQNPNENSKNPFWPIFKPVLIATITASAILFSRFFVFTKPAIATFTATANMVTDVKDGDSEDEKERAIEEHLVSNPNDVEGLRTLMEIKMKCNKLVDAVSVIDRLIELEPNDLEWPLLKSHLYIKSGEVELAKVGFSEILKKDPFRVEAYHGLVMAASQDDSSIEELKDIENKVEEGIKMCKKENKKDELRDFKLLLAQIRVIDGKYYDALKVYQELVKEEPRDFRPYLCQGIIYTLLRNNNEAEKCFEKYKRLVPQEHPYTSYFNQNMVATKDFVQKVDSERAGSES